MKISLFDKYKNAIKNIFEIDDKAVEMLCFEAERIQNMTLLSKHTFFFHGLLSIITNFLYPLKGIKRNVNVKDNDDFIFVSCPDTIFRTKTIDIIAHDLKYRLLYLPNFHIMTALKYHRFFKEQGVNAYFLTVKLSDVYKAQKKVNRFIKNVGLPPEDLQTQRMISVLSSFAIYDPIAKRCLDSCKSFKGKWILEHDKFYFMATVINLHQIGFNCTMLQHGVFFRPSFNYIPLYCDNVLCCSEREKQIYVDNGIAESRISVFGAPLQTLQLNDDLRSTENKFDILIMLTLVNEENIEVIKAVLKYVKSKYQKVLVRLRPRSRREDEILLQDEIQGMKLNVIGSSIIDDISCCKKVISFSEDANVEIAKMQKPFVYVWTEGDKQSSCMDNCATMKNYKEEINKLMSQEFYSTFNKEQYKTILGETDISVLQNRMRDFIRN